MTSEGNRDEPTAVGRRLLLVEDEPGLVLTLTDRLTSEGYEVATAPDGETALDLVGQQTYSLILLDVMLPGKNGFDVCRDMRQKGITTPILMLTARSQVVDKVVGLKLGADDYLTKPFEMMELLARVEALLRRTPVADQKNVSGSYSFGSIRVDFRSTEVTKDGEPLELSALEFKLLKYFIENRGATISRDELLDKVLGYDAMPYSRTVDVHVSWLRQKLEPNPSHPELILTVHRQGYKFAG